MNTAQQQTVQPKVREKSSGYIVAIGASAGGLEAIHEFFDHMPASSSFSFVVIQHLSSDYKSLLVELVSKHTHMKVFEAENNMALHPDCVYIIPNNKLMTVKHGKVRLADKTENKAPNTAVDTFLLSLAEDKKDKAIAIILSGTGSDGTKGIEAVKKNGGMVIVQEPASAKFDGMPNNAITSGNADFILSPARMHEELFKYVDEEPIKLLDNGKIDDSQLDKIFKLVHAQSGNDFHLYKTPTIIRRIGRRLNEVGAKTLDDYVKYIEGNAEEVKILGKDFLIGVTKFFRDKQAFDCLADKVLPDIIAGKANDDLLKIWVCACSTGEEAYSIAVLVNECIEKAGKRLDVKIFATDIDEASIEIASRNQYPLQIAKEVPPAYLKKYFAKEGTHYSLMPVIRKQIVFAKHDVIKSPPFIKNDLVTCRNMLIYMNSLLQTKVLSTFHFSLNQGGYLFLGSSETAGPIKEGLVEINGKWKIYKKSGYITFSLHNSYHVNNRAGAANGKSAPVKDIPPISTLERDFNDFMVEEAGYVGIYIDKSYIIQEAIGNFRQFLALPEKKIELNLLRMVPRGVSVVLNTAIRKAWKENKVTQLKRIRIKKNDQEVYLNVFIKPPARESGKNFTLVVLSESVVEILSEKEDVLLSSLPDEQQNEYIFELEAELNETRNNLQMAVEEMETTNEELQSSNEELLSANEELQSSNEELQSLNEELHTLNTEHQVKIRELVELNDDLDNYFRSIDVGLIFLDANLVIRKFNHAAIDTVNLIDADIGRSIEQITNNFKDQNLVNEIRAVILNNKVIEKETILKNNKRVLIRIMPYVRRDKKIDGVIISFVDITLVTELNNIIMGVFNASISAVLAFASIRNREGQIIDFKCIAFNSQALVMLRKNDESLTDSFLLKQLPEIADGNLFNRYVQVAQNGTILQTEITIGKDAWYQVVAVKMDDGFAVTFTDITDRKQADQKLKKNYNDLISTREMLKQLNNELEDKIRERTQELAQNNERFSLILKASNDTIWDWDLVNNQMWRSDNFTAMFGYHLSDETKDINFWFKKVHPADKERVTQSVYDAINNGKKQWSAEYRFQKADGSYATILDRGSIQHDDFGTPFRMVGSIVDITRLIEAEKKVSASENKFRKIFESNLIGMLFSDLETGYVQDANPTFLKMIGYTPADMVSRRINWVNMTPPEYRTASREAIEALKRDGYCPPYEKEYIHKDGHRISVLIGSAVLGEENQNDVVTYVIDITRQKEEERRKKELQNLIRKQQNEFYSVFKSAPALITIRRGSDLRYEFVNEAMLAFNGDLNYISRPFFEVHPELKSSEFAKADEHVLKTGETLVIKAMKFERKHGNTKEKVTNWLDCIFTPVRTDNGKIDGIAFFGFDVTDLLVAQEATKELMRKKDEFMSIASHELKTPITTIKGALQLAQRATGKGSSIEEIALLLKKANKQIVKLTGLVDDLLDVTKMQAGKLQFTITKFSVNELIEECVDQMQANLGNHIIKVDAPESALIAADKNRIEQVLINFLSNAAKYSPGQHEIIITSQLLNQNVRIAVKDFGIGIPDDKKAYVFDRFFRVEEASKKFSGLGLGLYISSDIIKRHHGEIG
ncbi:MAG: chemotaxis protein CheB, partial [Mucilaginibacter sp.]